MSKNPFEQPIKREEPPIEEMRKKLDKAKKMVEGVKERWKDKIEEFVEESVKKLKKLWEENEEEARKKKNRNEFFSFFSSLHLPEIPPFLLERTSNKFLKEFDWKELEKKEIFLKVF